MENNPLLFINSVNVIKKGLENEIIYDSRKTNKSMVNHRLDDLRAILFYDLEIMCYILLNNDSSYLGIPIEINDYFISILVNNKKQIIYIKDIKDIMLKKNNIEI